MRLDADLDLLGVLVGRRRRLFEVADVLRRYGFAAIAAQLENAGRPGYGIVQTMAERLIDPSLASASAGERLRGALTELGTCRIGPVSAAAAACSAASSTAPADAPPVPSAGTCAANA